jgi:hypothetical protein
MNRQLIDKDSNMVKWVIGNSEAKNALEIKTWSKGDQIIRLKEVYRFGEWTCESEIKPDIDLTNNQGFEITASEYPWEMEFMSDGMGYEWEFPKRMKKAEKDAIEAAWAESFYEGLEMLGWEEQSDSHWIFGPISLGKVIDEN